MHTPAAQRATDDSHTRDDATDGRHGDAVRGRGGGRVVRGGVLLQRGGRGGGDDPRAVRAGRVPRVGGGDRPLRDGVQRAGRQLSAAAAACTSQRGVRGGRGGGGGGAGGAWRGRGVGGRQLRGGAHGVRGGAWRGAAARARRVRAGEPHGERDAGGLGGAVLRRGGAAGVRRGTRELRARAARRDHAGRRVARARRRRGGARGAARGPGAAAGAAARRHGGARVPRRRGVAHTRAGLAVRGRAHRGELRVQR